MGLLRLYLAFSVVQAHAGPVAWFSLLPATGGRQAVCLFFVISGFYMAMVLNTKYRRPDATALFYTNRFLRLMPSYWIVAALDIALFALLGRALLFGYDAPLPALVADLRAMPGTTQAFLAAANLTGLGQDLLYLMTAGPQGLEWQPYGETGSHDGIRYLVNSPFFSVSLEIYFYLIAPFTLRRGWGLAAIVCALGLAYHAALAALGQWNLTFAYALFPASLFFFYLGACGYFLASRAATAGWRGSRPILAAFGALLAAAFAMVLAYEIDLFLRAAIVAAILPLLFGLTARIALDRLLGELSYAIYVVHYPVTLLMQHWHEARHVGSEAAAVTLALALLLYFLVERPVDRWRQARLALPRQGASMRLEPAG